MGLIDAWKALWSTPAPVVPSRGPTFPVQRLRPSEVTWKLYTKVWSTGGEYTTVEFTSNVLERVLARAVKEIPQGFAGDLIGQTPIGNAGFSISRGKKRLGLMRTSHKNRMLAVAVLECFFKDHEKVILDGVPWEMRTKGVSLTRWNKEDGRWEYLYDWEMGKGSATFEEMLKAGET